MRFITALAGFLLVVSLANAATVQRRTYRNTEEILVPVTIIHSDDEIKNLQDIKENETVPQVMNLALKEEQAMAADILAAIEEEEKLQAEEPAAVEKEINAVIKEEQDKEKNILKILTPETPEKAIPEAAEEPAKTEEEKIDAFVNELAGNKSDPIKVIVLVEKTANEKAEQPEGSLRQATQATPSQTTTPQNFVQQFIQNSPLGQLFNQITGQNTQNQGSNDETAPAAPAPPLPGLFNPVAAVQNAAQSVVNSTTQAFQGFQQFASNLGNQFQSTLSSLGGQPQEAAANDATTARPPGPIQQLVNNIIGNPQQAQPAPASQGPLQGLLNIFQGNNRPQAATAAAVTTPEPQQTQQSEALVAADEHVIKPHEITNEIRESGEVNDSFEDSVQPDELIVVNDDESQNENDNQEKDNANVTK